MIWARKRSTLSSARMICKANKSFSPPARKWSCVSKMSSSSTIMTKAKSTPSLAIASLPPSNKDQGHPTLRINSPHLRKSRTLTFSGQICRWNRPRERDRRRNVTYRYASLSLIAKSSHFVMVSRMVPFQHTAKAMLMSKSKKKTPIQTRETRMESTRCQKIHIAQWLSI